MKRGFLNTEKAKRNLAAEADVPKGSSADKGKGKAKEEIPSCANEIGCHSPLLDPHALPFYFMPREGEKRTIFRHWSRDPNGKPIVAGKIRGKEAGNGLDLWGATLYDFYYVHRFPSITQCMTVSTGSKLANIMRSLGELDFASKELEWASLEADPREILAWDPAQATMIHELRVHASSGIAPSNKESTPLQVPIAEHDTDAHTLGAFKPASDPIGSINGTVEALKDPASENCANKQSNKLTDSINTVGAQPLPSDTRLESPFHPTHYPSPWPLVPFESPCFPFPLQRAIPIHLLPKKLHVHDPWNLLHAQIYWRDGGTWSSKTDRIRTYTLSLPPELQKKADAASRAAAAPEDEPTKTIIFPQETEGPTEKPAIQIFLTNKPRKPTHVSEAHLYLSPRGKLGTGNHSIVYEADLELPRDLFCESTYCETCLREQVEANIDLLKESGEWERRLNEEAEKFKGQHFASHDTAASSSSQTPPRYVGFVKVKSECEPMRTRWEAPVWDAPIHNVRVSDRHHVEYDGAVVPIHLNVQWQNPSFPETICVHQAKEKKPVPRTATFRVAAKLSFYGDPHLQREASNYLKFPAHFFQYWSGYNVMPPLIDPIPVGALVPQFFGYYTPDDATESDDEDTYLSPILLIEHCGKPICASKLSIDDRRECVALLFRFHYAGWLHESFAERNILMQKRHPTRSPIEDDDRTDEKDTPYKRHSHSFRLIDFGRSLEYMDAPDQVRAEQRRGKELLDVHCGNELLE